MKHVLLLSLVLFAGACTKEAPRPTEAAKAPTNGPLEVNQTGQRLAGIETVVAEMQSLPFELEAPGTLQWNEDRTWAAGAVTSGKIVKSDSKVGDMVKQGQVLAQMHTHEVHDTKAGLRQALTERARAQSQLQLAERNRDRMKRLYDLKAVALMEVEHAEGEIRNAEAAVKKAAADIERETQHLTEVLEISADLEDKHPGGVDEDELVPIKAPGNGLIVERKISAGVVVTAGQECFVITDPESLWLIASFPETALSQLRVGQKVEVEVQAFSGLLFTGNIARLGDTLDHETRTLKVRIAMAARGKLKPEMFARVRLGGTSQTALTIPESAVQDVNGQMTVFVRTGPTSFEPRPITAEIKQGRVLVSKGLKAGDKVAANGSYLLKGKLVGTPEE